MVKFMECPHAKWGTTSFCGSRAIFSKMFQFNENSLFLPQPLLSGPTAPWIPKRSSPASPDDHLILPFVLVPSLFIQNSYISTAKRSPAGMKMGIWVEGLGKNYLTFTFLMIPALRSLEKRYFSQEWRVLPGEGKSTLHWRDTKGSFFLLKKESLEITIPRKQEIKSPKFCSKGLCSPQQLLQKHLLKVHLRHMFARRHTACGAIAIPSFLWLQTSNST